MGGAATVPSNLTPAAELNIGADPEAATISCGNLARPPVESTLLSRQAVVSKTGAPRVAFHCGSRSRQVICTFCHSAPQLASRGQPKLARGSLLVVKPTSRSHQQSS